MDCRKWDICIISANDLENVRNIGRLKTYGKVSIAGEPETERQTPVDKHGKTNPAWNFSTSYYIDDLAVQHEGVMLVIKLYCQRTLGDRYIGEIHVSIKQLFDYARGFENRRIRRQRKNYYRHGGSAVISLPVQKGSAISMGKLKFSYRFGKKLTVEQPSLWESVLPVAVTWIRVILVSTLGATVPIAIPYFL